MVAGFFIAGGTIAELLARLTGDRLPGKLDGRTAGTKWVLS